MNIIGTCPNCKGKMHVRELVCDSCELEMRGKFELTKFDFLDKQELYFVELFLANQGNIKEMEKDLKISYPTVKKMLEQVVRKLNLTLKGDSNDNRRRDVYERVARKEITLEEAEKLLEE